MRQVKTRQREQTSTSSVEQRPAIRSRRGITAVLAMVYLVLFTTMAIGFYAAVTTSGQIAGNEQRTMRSRLAAESGMQFMKYQFATLNIAADTPKDQLFDAVFTRLSEKLNGYPNMAGLTVTKSADENTIYVPGTGDTWIEAETGGAKFRAVIEKKQNGAMLQTTVTGRHGTYESKRSIRLSYAVAENASSIFNYGVASKSRLLLNSNAKVRGASDLDLGSVLSTAPPGPLGEKVIIMQGNAQITGEVSFSDPAATAATALAMSSNATIGNDPAARRSDTALLAEYVNYDVPPPEFPTINSDVFKPFAGNPTYGGTTITPPNAPGVTTYDSGTLRNVLIKASPHPDHKVVFSSNLKIEGVIYIEAPNRVEFNSNVEITGAVVVETNPTGDHTRNSLEFHSNVTIKPIENLVALNSPYYPKDLTDLTGASILAPKFDLLMNSNFGTTGGSIIADKINFDSNARGTVRGSVINMANTMVEMDSNADILIETTGTSDYPAGVYFGSHYTPLPDTYEELKQ